MSSCGEGKLSLGSYMRLCISISNHMGKRNLTKVVSSCGEGKLSLGSYMRLCIIKQSHEEEEPY